MPAESWWLVLPNVVTTQWQVKITFDIDNKSVTRSSHWGHFTLVSFFHGWCMDGWSKSTAQANLSYLLPPRYKERFITCSYRHTSYTFFPLFILFNEQLRSSCKVQNSLRFCAESTWQESYCSWAKVRNTELSFSGFCLYRQHHKSPHALCTSNVGLLYLLKFNILLPQGLHTYIVSLCLGCSASPSLQAPSLIKFIDLVWLICIHFTEKSLPLAGLLWCTTNRNVMCPLASHNTQQQQHLIIVLHSILQVQNHISAKIPLWESTIWRQINTLINYAEWLQEIKMNSPLLNRGLWWKFIWFSDGEGK